MKVLLEKGVWLTDIEEGDPPRTLVEEHAKEFDSFAEAYAALNEAKKYKPFPNAEIQIQDDFLW